MTKDQMQQIIDRQAQQLHELSERISALEANNDEMVKASTLYQAIKYENKSLKQDIEYWKLSAENANIQVQELRRRKYKTAKDVLKILNENQELVKQHGGDYWIGITRSSDARYLRSLEKENKDLQKENEHLKSKLENTEKREHHLQNQYTQLLYALHPEDMPELKQEEPKKNPTIGRPKIASIGETIEARKMRKAGWSIREIASYMGWSIGLTQKTVASVDVDPEVIQKHRAENRKLKKKN